MSHAIREISRYHVLVGVIVLGGLFLGTTSSTAAQEPTPGVAALTGTAYRLVEQEIVDGVIVNQTQVPVTDGRIAIPELGIDQPLAADGSFNFSDLPVSADLDNPTVVTVIFTAPGLGSFTYLNLRLFLGTILTPQLTDTPFVNDRSRAHGGLPETGGGSVGASSTTASAGLLVLVGAALVCAGASIRLVRRST